MAIPRWEERKLVPYEDAIQRLQRADLLQFRANSFIGYAISVVGRSPYSHTAMADRVNGHWECLEVREFVGGRISNLAYQVEMASGYIDVYRPTPRQLVWDGAGWEAVEFDADAVADRMRELCRPYAYGYRSIAAIWATHFPLLRWCIPVECDEKEQHRIAPYCAEAYSNALRHGYVDPVPNRPDWRTEPGDLTRSAVLDNYLFTMTWRS